MPWVPGPRARLAPLASGPLDGLSFAVKDLIDVAGMVTGGGNPDWRRRQTLGRDFGTRCRAPAARRRDSDR